MAKIIKNISNSAKTWGGVLIQPNDSYTCNDQTEATKFSKDDNLIASLASADAKVFSNTTEINGSAISLDFLRENKTATDGTPLITSQAFVNADGFRFRGASFTGSCQSDSSSDIDYKIIQERYINGGVLIVDHIGVGDKITFQVIDKDNIMGFGANIVLDEFIKDYYIPSIGLLEVKLDYPAKIPANLYLRLKYTSTHELGCSIKCNLYLHWKAV